jgi:CBS-domain-containing membrane protein
VKVREIMVRDVVQARADTPVHLIAQQMRDHNVSGVPVVDDAGSIIGIVSELDLIVRNTRLDPPAFFQILDGQIPLESPEHYQERLRHMLGTHAADVMTEEVVIVGPDAELEDLAELMVKRGVNPIPVVEDGVMVGIVSRHDIVRMMAADAERERPGAKGERG